MSDKSSESANSLESKTNLIDQVLGVISARQFVHEEKLLSEIYPEPVYPINGSDADKEQWRSDYEAWKDRAYSSPTVPYVECYTGILSGVCIELQRMGKIRTHNNGFNSYTYEAVGGAK